MDSLMEKLLKAPGVSGYESGVASVIAEELKKHSTNIETDNMGNIIAHKGSGKKKINPCWLTMPGKKWYRCSILKRWPEKPGNSIMIR